MGYKYKYKYATLSKYEHKRWQDKVTAKWPNRMSKREKKN